MSGLSVAESANSEFNKLHARHCIHRELVDRGRYKNGSADGPVTALHPGSRIHFFHMLERFRAEDFEYVHDNGKANRFAYLSNGFSTKELGSEDYVVSRPPG
ncbi:hypothetical protein BJX99DRAFT_231461 [Aspergillus californicus]